MSDETLIEKIEPTENSEPTWWIDEGIPGQGERPTWLNNKFKNVSDMAKSHQELEKKLGGAPDQYDFSKSKYLDPEYAPFQELQELAKSKRVPAEVMDKVLDSFDRYMNEFTNDPAEEMKKLGNNSQEKLTILNNWAKANLSDESFKALTNSIRTADGVKALDELRGKMMSNTTTIPGNDNSGKEALSANDLQSELNSNLNKYKTDPKYRREMEVKFSTLIKSQG